MPGLARGRFGLRFHMYRNRTVTLDDHSATILYGGGSGAMIPGDLNAGGAVNVADLAILGAAYGQLGDLLVRYAALTALLASRRSG